MAGIVADYSWIRPGRDTLQLFADMLWTREGRAKFMRWAVQQNGTDCFLCVLCISQYRANPTQRKATAIVEVFLDDKAPMFLNVPPTCRGGALATYVSYTLSASTNRGRGAPPPKDMFVPIQSETLSLLVDLTAGYSDFVHDKWWRVGRERRVERARALDALHRFKSAGFNTEEMAYTAALAVQTVL